MDVQQEASMSSDRVDKEPTTGGIERRQFERFETSIMVDYSNGETFLFSYIQNISEMGIFIRTDEPLPVGTSLELRFAPAGQTPIELPGEVTWVNPVRPLGDNINPGMGVRFRELDPDARERVVDLVRTIAYLRSDDQT